MKLHRPALTEACADLGVKRPVRVDFVRPGSLSAPEVRAAYSGFDEYEVHRVAVLDTLPFYVASTCLWHELVHASQCEAAGGWWAFDQEYLRQCADHGVDPFGPTFHADYTVIPYEREAFTVQTEARRGRRPILCYDPDHPTCQVDAIVSDPGGRTEAA